MSRKLRMQEPHMQRPQNQKNQKIDDEPSELQQLFNKKYQFQYNSDWKLPEADLWFSTPAWKVKELETEKSQLNLHKSQLNDFNIEEWSSHTRRRNPAGEVGWKIKCLVNPEFLTQAWTKFYECASAYNIIPPEAIIKKKLVSLHLCEAPGAFITSLNHYLKQKHKGLEWEWVANTLNPYYEGNSPSSMISDDRFMFHTLDKWDFGADSTGNLMIWENSQAVIAKAQSLGKVQLVTADGSIDCLQKPDVQEEMTSPLHYCEIVTALQALCEGGTLIFKLFTTLEHSTICLLYLINNAFNEVNIFKPVTSRQGNSEVYAICINYKGKAAVETYFPVLKSAYGTDMYGNVALFPLESLPESFLKQIQECANYFCAMQCQVINKNLQAYIMQKDVGLHMDMRRIRASVACEFFKKYSLKPIKHDKEILKGILHEENKANMNPRYHRGSYTERHLYTKMSLREKLSNLNSFLQAEALTNPVILISDKVEWLTIYKPSFELKLNFTYGQPLKKINSSKFIFVPIFKLYQQILAEDEFKDILFTRERQDKLITDNFGEYGVEIHKVLCLQEYNHQEDYNMYEKRSFKLLLQVLKQLSLDQTLMIMNVNILTQFYASLLYIAAKECFEKTGFTSTNSIILCNLKNKKALNYLDMVESECDKVRTDGTKDVLNSLTVQTTNAGKFYHMVLYYNNTSYKNKCAEYIEKIERYI